MGAVLTSHRHGHRRAVAGRQRRRRQRRWNSGQCCAVGSERTCWRYSRLTWQRLRRKLTVHIHKTTAALRSVHAVVLFVQLSAQHQHRHTLHSCNSHSNGDRQRGRTRHHIPGHWQCLGLKNAFALVSGTL
jgi:hypothetical protein